MMSSVGIAEGSGLSMNEVLFLSGPLFFELDVAGPLFGRLHSAMLHPARLPNTARPLLAAF